PSEKMFHLAGLGFDGRVGYSVISKASESFSLGLAMEEFGSRYFGQGTHLGGLIKHPGRLSPEAKDNLKSSFDNVYKGLTGSHVMGVLEEGMSYEAFGIPPNDSQFLESRVFQVTEVARWFNLPPHKIKDLTRSTFSNIESSQIEFVTDSVRPWLVRWEQVIGWKLLSIIERRNIFAEYIIEGLLRGDIKTRFEAYAIARANGFMNADQVRAKENMNPTEDGSGKIYNIPLNWTNAANLLLPPEEPEDEPFDEPDEDDEEEENALVALYEEELTPEHTHLEIDETDVFGVISSITPYGNHNSTSKLIKGTKSYKQALGLYSANYLSRLDTDVSILQYPQKPIVRSFVYDTLNTYPAGQNLVVAIMTYEGYNMEDALVFNKGSLERGVGRSFYFRPYFAIEMNYAGGLKDEIMIPEKDASGYKTESSYRFLEADGLVYP
ncbi:hypothetical protein LCGC14_2695700, partial [marine sediment metagenome]